LIVAIGQGRLARVVFCNQSLKGLAMNPGRNKSVGWVGRLAAVMLGASLIAGTARGEDAKPEEVMTAKGLTKTGVFYVLKEDAAIGEDLRKFRLAKTAYDTDTKKRLECENKIKMAKNAMSQWEYEYRALNEKLAAGIADNFQHNKAIGEINALVSKMKEGEEFVKLREGEMAKFNASREAYITAAIELTEKMEKVLKTYEALAKDEEVTKALVVINDKARPKMKLGPSVELTQNLAFVKKQRGDINSAIVKLKVENNTPTVEVTINGKITRTMILDSGASVIAVTAGLARELGMRPGPQDPVVRMRLADGKLVDARQMYLKTVRVGSFTIENVECAVLPESLVAAEDLLGGSFLRNFVYKIDPEAGELHLAQIGKAPAAGGGAAGAAKKEMPK